MFTSDVIVYQWYYCLPVMFTSDVIVYQWYLPVLFTNIYAVYVVIHDSPVHHFLSIHPMKRWLYECNWSFSCNNNGLLWHAMYYTFAWKFKVQLINFLRFVLPRKEVSFLLAVDQLAGRYETWWTGRRVLSVFGGELRDDGWSVICSPLMKPSVPDGG